ncbi:MAG: MFS transporter, partial [Chloroflexota bacterium]
LVAGAAVSVVLVTSLGGTSYPWFSAPIILLAVAAVVLIIGFIAAERRATEPVLPLRLFGNRVFAVAAAISFVVGFAMFGSITYLPLFLQVVKGASPTSSGLRLLPMMAGLLLTSTVSGQLISRWGRYKIFPIVGTGVFSAGLFLLSRMDEYTSTLTSSIDMFVLGLGLGMVMQVLVIAAQNAVDYRDLGVATSGATFFRSIGSSIGVAIFGAIFSNELAGNLTRFVSKAALPPGFNLQAVQSSPAALKQLPPAVHADYVHAYAASLQPVFLIAGVVGILAFALTWLLREVPLRATSQATDPGQTYAMPTARTSREEIERALGVLAGRETRRRVYTRIAARAGLALDPSSSWLLFRIDQYAPATLEDLSTRLHVPSTGLGPILDRLTQAGLVAVDHDSDGKPGQIVLTPSGRQARDRLVAARRDGLTDLLAGWPPEQQNELADLLGRLARGLLGDDPGGKTLAEAPLAAPTRRG